MTTTTHSESGKRSSVMTFRASPAERMLIAKAAKSERLEPSAYVRKSLVKQAEMDLADRSEFLILPKDMDSFLAALDRPVRKKTRLNALLNKKTVLD